MALDCVQSGKAVSSANLKLTICGLEFPVEKVDIKLSAKKTDITSTASVVNGIVWDEYAPGSSGGAISWDTKWRIGQQVSPKDVRAGGIYAVVITATASWTASTFVDSNDISIDVRSGVIEWKVAATATGPIS